MSEEVRLQKYLAQAGLASRRGAEKLILDGKVKVNDNIVSELGVKVNPDKDKVEVEGEVLKPEKKVYLLLNKPKGYVCTKKDRHAEKTIYDLLPDNYNLHSVGRLDKDTEGLILLTNDGELTQKLTHPSYKVSKSYLVTVKGRIETKALIALQKGVMIPVEDKNKMVKTLPAKVRLIGKGRNTSTLEITIKEGRKRQVRLMCKAVGHPVVDLKRIREGNLTLEGLSTGKYRFLTKSEINKLKNDK